MTFLRTLATEALLAALWGVAAVAWQRNPTLLHGLFLSMLVLAECWAASQIVAWQIRERNAGPLLLRLSRSSAPQGLRWLRRVAILSTLWVSMAYLFGWTTHASPLHTLLMAICGVITFLWLGTYVSPAEVRAWGIQVGPTLLQWRDIARYQLDGGSVALECGPTGAGWRRISLAIDSGDRSAFLELLTRYSQASAHKP